MTRCTSASMIRVSSKLGYTAPKLAFQLRTLGLILGSQSPDQIGDALTNPNLGELLGGSKRGHSSSCLRSPRGLDTLSTLMAHDQQVWLPDNILVKVDRATMDASLESRTPFLDHRLVELAWRIPNAMKLQGSEGKWVLRQVLGRYLPPEIFTRPKQGFCIPISDWLNGPLASWANDLLGSTCVRDLGFADSVIPRLHRHNAKHKVVDRRLWAVLMYASWKDQRSAPLCGKKAA